MNKDNYPKHWQKVKLRQILKPFSEKNYPELPLLSVVREKGVIIRNIDDMEENHNYVPDDLSNYKRVKCGQFAINKMKAWQGSYGISKYNGIVSPAYFVFDVTYDMNLDFFNRAIRSKAYIGYFGQASDGIRVGQWDLSMHRMKEIPFFIPPRNEQDKIAEFLDSKTEAIDKLIEIRQAEIEKLNELRKSVINNAVTRGISKNTIMNKVEMNWISEIPSNWKTKKIKYIFSERVEKGFPYETLLVSSQNMGVVPKDVYGNRTVEALKDLHLLKLVHEGDFVISLRAFQGGIEYAYYRGIISPAYTILINNGGIFSPYFRYLAKSTSFIGLLKLCVTGIREGQNIDYNKLKNFKIPIPPLNEQQEIVDFLDNKILEIEKLLNVKNNEIKYLEELKTSLIADTVIGKIDVRHINC